MARGGDTRQDLPAGASGTPGQRIDALDVARGVALLAMAVYHLSWDLRWFALVDWPVDSAPGWRAFAAAIASTFLALAGMSLVLAHGRGIRRDAVLRRTRRIALAAAAISLGTYLALGDQYVRFGILHEIALGSLLALPALRLPPLATLVLAALVIALPHWVSLSFVGDSWFTFTGLVGYAPPSVDHVPLFPWLGAILAGVALMRLAQPGRLWQRLRTWRAEGRATRLAALAGRHSLAVYLVHQPILYGCVWALVSLGLVPDPAERAFVEQCVMACSLADPEQQQACAAACSCTLETVLADGTWDTLSREPGNPQANAALSAAYGQCRRTPAAGRP